MSNKPSRKASKSSKPAKPKPNRHNPPAKAARRAAVPSAAAAASQSISLLADMLWLLVLLFSVCLALALASFTMDDPAWSRSIPTGNEPHNLAGLLGAYTADVAYYLFGLSVWWLLLAAVVWLYRNFRSVKQSSEKPYHLGMGLGGAALLLFGSPLLEAAAWSAELHDSLPMGAGGLIGQSLGSGFTRLLGVSGSLLVQVVLIVAGLSLLLQVSWLTLLEKAGAQLEWLWYRLIRQPHQFVRDIPNAKFARRMVRAAKTITAEEVATVEGASSNRKPVAVQINQPADQGLPEKEKRLPLRKPLVV